MRTAASCFSRAGTADKAGVKAMQELQHALGVIALRIDGDVHDLHLAAAAPSPCVRAASTLRVIGHTAVHEV